MESEHKVTWIVGGTEEVRWRKNFWRDPVQQPKRWMRMQTLHIREYSDKGWELLSIKERQKGTHLYMRYCWNRAKTD